MYDFHPYFTKDGSVGLYSPKFNDIYHSATGALTEACEKFVLPANIDYLLQTKNEIKVLDICYGIGYNTKSFLKNILEKLAPKISPNTDYYAQIYTNNNFCYQTDSIAQIHTNKSTSKTEEYIGEIDTYNALRKISVTAVDNDKILIFLSPFIKTGEKDYKKYNSSIHYEKIHKYLDNPIQPEIIKIDNEINLILLAKILIKYSEEIQKSEIWEILSNPIFEPFFEEEIRRIFESYIKSEGNYTPSEDLYAFLHNIYYHHVSDSYKTAVEALKTPDVDLDFHIDDARNVIKHDKNRYNLIFLDAFTPSKCPCLWSYEFFKELFNHLEQDGMLLTYSSSASVRGGMIEAGFAIGNIFSERENKFFGTVAVKDKSLIKHPLSEFDLGLLKTRAGIFYRDPNLTWQNEAIIEARNSEVKNSIRMSTSQYRKGHG